MSNGCGSVSSDVVKVKITLNDNPQVDLTVSKSVVCSDSTVLLTASPSGGGKDFTYTFMDGTTAISSVDQTASTFRTSGLTANASFTVVLKFTTPCPAPGVTSPGSVTSGPKTVQVDKYVAATVGTPNPKPTCADEVTLPGGINPSLATAQGTWSISSTSPNSATIQDLHNPTSNLSNIAPNATVDLMWVVQNGVCPKDTALYTVKQVGTITKARISIDGSDRTNRTADSLCVGSNYTLSGTDPLKTGETRTWKLEVPGTTGITLGSATAISQAIQAFAADTSVISYVIHPSLSGCPSDSATITLIVHDKPIVAGLTVPSVMPCEGALDRDTVFAQYTSSLKPSFFWSMTSSGTGTVTLANDSDTMAVLNAYTSSVNTGWKDSVAINAIVSNVCGHNSASNKVVFKLKPRDFAIGDSILGPTIICESNDYTLNYFGKKQPYTDSIRWYWNDVYQGTTVNDPGNPKDTMWFERSKTWGDITNQTYANVKAELGNICGYHATMTRKDTIIPAKEFNFSVVSDKAQNSFCVPLDVVGVWAQQTQPDSMTYGNVAEYSFSSASGVLQAQSASRVFRSMYTGDTTITVTAYPQLWACLSDYSSKSLSISLKGFSKPVDTLSFADTVFCEGANTAQLFISPKSKNAGDFVWYRIDGGGANSLNKNNQNPLTLSSPSESGSYYAVIENALKKIDPNTLCPGTTTKTVSIKIFDRPNPLISPNPLLIYYDENSPGVQMPFITTGTADSVFDVHYDPGQWLSTQDSLIPTIKTTKEEIEQEYTLTLYSGVKGGPTCKGSTSVRIINTLPLRIPNAFSPNGDSKNETWVIEGLGKYPNTKVKVFNRWGGAVFTDNYGYNVPWDGTNNGIALPSGTYYYVINLLGSPDGQEEVRTGSLTIVR